MSRAPNHTVRPVATVGSEAAPAALEAAQLAAAGAVIAQPSATPAAGRIVDPATPAPVAPVVSVDPLLPTPVLHVSSPIAPVYAAGRPLRIDGPALVVVCRVAGFRRAGLAHPPRAVYPLDHFTAQQLRQLAEEPNIEMIAIGGEPAPRDAVAV